MSSLSVKESKKIETKDRKMITAPLWEENNGKD